MPNKATVARTAKAGKGAIASTPWDKTTGNTTDAAYAAFLARIQARFALNTEGGKRQLFRVETGELWPHYLEAFPEPGRQHHNCTACRHFLRRFGGLVVLDSGGRVIPAMWHEEDAPPDYKSAIKAIVKVIKRSPVVNPFYSDWPMWGQRTTGVWNHMAVIPEPSQLYSSRVDTSGQKMAEKRQDFGSVSRALSEYDAATAAIALTLLETDSLYRSEKVLGVAKWFVELHKARENLKGTTRDNVTWLAVAAAPSGFCHIRSSMIGTLLDDIIAGKTMADVAASFKAKMAPLQYQRPQAAPSRGNVQAAEKLVQSLGLAPSLRRRFARLEDVQALWTPTAWGMPAGEGVFGHIRPKDAKPTVEKFDLPAINATFVKFRRDVLPDARVIEVYAPVIGNYAALTTAADPAAPPIVQWDMDAQRNPVAYYVYAAGSSAENWGLVAMTYVRATAVALAPHMWNGEDSFKQYSKAAVFILEGCVDKTEHLGNALFPEDMKSELRPVRATIEAYSKTAEIEERASASACGLWCGGEGTRVRVTNASGHKVDYLIDRWE